MVSWAYLYLASGADPAGERDIRERSGERATLVAVPDERAAARVAVELVQDGVGLIELCGGFGTSAAAEVLKAVDGRVPVGTVSFATESLQGAAAYQRAAEATG